MNNPLLNLCFYSSGLDFDLAKVPAKNLLLLGVKGRSLELESKFLDFFKIQYIKTQLNTNVRNIGIDPKIINCINCNNPIIVIVDRYYLDYLKINRNHFGYHAVIVTGYNLEKGDVVLIDGLTGRKEILSIKNFNQALTKEEPYESEAGTIYTISNYGSINITIQDYMKALSDQCNYFFADGGIAFKIKVIINYLQRTSKNALQNNEITMFLRVQLALPSSTFREQDVDGSFYRRLYFNYLLSDFNRTSFNEDDFKYLSNLADDDIRLWREIGSNDFADVFQKSEYFIEKLSEILNCETEIFSILRNVRLDYDK